MKSNPNIIRMKGLRKKIDLSKVRWNSDTGSVGEEIELSPEKTEEIKEQTRQAFEAEGREWRGEVVTLYSIDSETGNLRFINLDFRDEAVKPMERKRRPRRRKRRKQSQSIGLVR